MSKANDRLRAIGIINSWDVMQRAHKDGLKEDVWLSYHAATTGRGSRSARWVVASKTHKTNPGAHWMDYGQKTFHVYSGKDRAEKLEVAKAWVAEKYGITEWAKIPGVYGAGNQFPKSVADHIKALLKEVEK